MLTVYIYSSVNLPFSVCFACGYIHSGEIEIFVQIQEHLGFAGAAPMPMLTSPYGAKLNCLSPPLPTLGATPSYRKSFHPWKKMSDAAGHYPFAAAAAYAPHYPAAMTSSLAGSRVEMTSERGGGGGIGDGSAGGGFAAAMHGYSHRGSSAMSSSSSCAMVPACVLPPGPAAAAAAAPTGKIISPIPARLQGRA